MWVSAKQVVIRATFGNLDRKKLLKLSWFLNIESYNIVFYNIFGWL